MFQVLVRFFEERYCSFFVDEPILEYNLLIQRIKSAIPCISQLCDDQIRVAYQDVASGCFINIDCQEKMHLVETFRNFVTLERSGYDRVNLKIWESDSPFIFRKTPKAQDVSVNNSENNATFCGSEIEDKDLNRNINTKAKKLDFSPATSDCANPSKAMDWKTNKMKEVSNKAQWLEDKKCAVEMHIRELELDVAEPLYVGNYRTVCGNCHVRGHRADGNRNKGACSAPACTSYFTCGQKKKHPEHFEQIRQAKKRLKDVTKELDNVNLEKKNLAAFQSKSISAFATAITPRLIRAFSDKYSLKTAKGKQELQKDIATLRVGCNNTVPENAGADKELFTSLLEQTQVMMSGMKNDAPSTSTINQITLAVSPVKIKRQSSKRLRRDSTDSTSTNSTSSSANDSSSDSSAERKYKKSKRRSHYHKKRDKRKRSARSKHHRKRSHRGIYDSEPIAKKNPADPPQVSGTRKEHQQKCSLDELATIAVAINNDKGQAEAINNVQSIQN